MLRRSKPNAKPKVTDDEIVRLYKSGLSQSAIYRQYKASRAKISKALDAAGLDTSNFQSLPPDIKETILALWKSGASYDAIESVCDISTTVSKSIIRKYGRKKVSRKSRTKSTTPVQAEEIIPGKGTFASQYENGLSFFALCQRMGIPIEIRVQLFWEIYSGQLTEANPRIHKRSIGALIRKDVAMGFSVTTIAQKHVVSNSVVQQALA